MLLSSHRGGARVGAAPLPEQTDRRKSAPGTNRRARQLTSHTHAGSTAPTLPASPRPATTNTYRQLNSFRQHLPPRGGSAASGGPGLPTNDRRRRRPAGRRRRRVVACYLPWLATAAIAASAAAGSR